MNVYTIYADLAEGENLMILLIVLQNILKQY